VYKDLLYMFIRRDIVTIYKQTILGPIWYFIQPLLTMVVYIIVFSNIANIPTDNVPPALFYLAGIVMWNYFSDSFSQTSDTFFQNASIFGKVYFPRIILPLSKVISTLIKFFIQALLFFAVYIYFFIRGSNLNPGYTVLLVPFYLFLMGRHDEADNLIETFKEKVYKDPRKYLAYRNIIKSLQ